MDAHLFLKSLTLVLCVAAVTTVVFQRLKQPVVLGYILAGLIVGPHLPVPLVADRSVVEALSELGIVLLMFSLGLEFSVGKLVRVGPTAGATAVIQCSLMMWAGFAAGRLFGWTFRESLFTGALIAISSTTIIAKAFHDQKIRGKLKELVVGVLIVEDLIAIVLMAMLTAVSLQSSQDVGVAPISALSLLAPAGQLAVFLAVFLTIGLFLVPRTIRAVSRFGNSETLLVASIGLGFGGALLAQEFGYSVALGAFIAGSLVSESGEGEKIERLIEPVKDMFAAVFFVSVGMLIDPSLVIQYWMPIAVLTAVVILGKIVGVAVGAFLTGSGVRVSVQAGLSLAQIGEFSFIIAALGLHLKAVGEFLYPVAVAVSAVTTLTTPWLIRASGPIANFVDRKMPGPLQTFGALYGNWLERIREAPDQATRGASVRRLIKLLAVDLLGLVGCVAAAFYYEPRVTEFITVQFYLAGRWAHVAFYGVLAFLCLPFIAGLFGIARQLGRLLAEAALPKTSDGQLDLAAAPRKALLVGLQLAVVIGVGTLLLALTQPFLPPMSSAILVVLLIAGVGILGVAFWRGAENLEGHVRAGSEMIIELLASQGLPKKVNQGNEEILAVLPGMGDPVSLRLPPGSIAVGKTLAQLNLRGVTGATVLAIVRSGKGVLPGAHEVLQADDILALAGTHEAVLNARSFMGAVSIPH